MAKERERKGPEGEIGTTKTSASSENGTERLLWIVVGVYIRVLLRKRAHKRVM